MSVEATVDSTDLPARRYSDRELSWVAWNSRVLDLAKDTQRVPLLERAKFLAIFASNLDEFFMVRVAGLKRRIEAGVAVTSVTGMQPREQLDAILAAVRPLVNEQYRVFTEQVRPELAAQGIEITAVCPYWIRDTEFITRAIETDHSGIFQGFPLACTQHEVASRSLRAARNHIRVCTPDMVSFLHRILTSCIPHSWLIHLSELYRRLA